MGFGNVEESMYDKSQFVTSTNSSTTANLHTRYVLCISRAHLGSLPVLFFILEYIMLYLTILYIVYKYGTVVFSTNSVTDVECVHFGELCQTPLWDVINTLLKDIMYIYSTIIQLLFGEVYLPDSVWRKSVNPMKHCTYTWYPAT